MSLFDVALGCALGYLDFRFAEFEKVPPAG